MHYDTALRGYTSKRIEEIESAATYHRWTHNRTQLVNLITPLYLGCVASFINQTRKMNSSQAEELVEEQAQVFEDHKDYLLEVWDRNSAQAVME